MSKERIDNLNASITDYKQRVETALSELGKIDAQRKPIENSFNVATNHLARLIDAKIASAHKMEASFSADELVFSASSRCTCGAGLAYPDGIGINGSWHCADILQGKAEPAKSGNAKLHTSAMPFSFYEIKSERDGLTTRN